MHLLSVDDVDANNECFDANVTVYNKINEPGGNLRMEGVCP